MNKKYYLLLILLVFIAMILDVCLGSVYIQPSLLIKALFNNADATTNYIILDIRLPRVIMAVLSGAGLSLAGVLMQTLFRNPLAGPFVLGISGGAGLGVALLVLGGTLLGISSMNSWSIVSASVIGSSLVLGLILLLSLRIKDTMGLLIVGLMVGSLSSAVIGILTYFSTSDQLQRYVFWSLGSLGNLQWDEISIMLIVLLICLGLLLTILKPLNSLLLGESYARSLGTSISKTKYLSIIITSLLAGAITAFAGPIAFIGLAVPHLARLWFPTVNHHTLIPTSMLMGALLLTVCDMIAQVPFNVFSVPINAVTSLIGAPIIIWLILKKKNLHF